MMRCVNTICKLIVFPAVAVAVVERRIISVETFYHPLNMIWHRQDGCETTVMTGEWTAANRSDKQHKRRRVLVHVVR